MGDSMTREPVAVLGGGAWGSMLAQLLAVNNERVQLWVRDAALREEMIRTRGLSPGLPGVTLSDRIQIREDLEEVGRGADVLFLAVPTPSFREVARRLGDVVEGDQMLISGARGLEPDTAARMSEVLAQETSSKLIGALGGPISVEDLNRGSPGAAAIGSRFEAVVTRVQFLLGSERLRLYGNRDLLGVELGGALSTVMTFACGLSHGLELGAAVKAVIINRGLAEISRLGVALGAQAATFQGLTGLGTLVAAALSLEGRDHRLGEMLAKGETLESALATLGPAECVSTTKMALELGARAKVELPLTAAMGKVLFQGVKPKEIIRGLMVRRAIYE